jgi:Ca2+-binding RTX toxin-like protein
MVNYIKSDLEFILDQIKIAEAHSAGQPLYGPGGLVPAYTLSLGLRTVDGRNNNLLAGQEEWGASGIVFPELLTPDFRPASDQIDFDGPGPGGLTAATYAPSNNAGSIVVDSSLRTISNLLVDQTLSNPAAIMKGLQIGGVASASMANVGLVQAIYADFSPFVHGEYQARVAAQVAHRAAQTNADPLLQAGLDAAAAAAAVTAATALADLGAARLPRDAALADFGIAMDGDNIQITNVAPDAGLSAPFNSWFTLFGQFFDHGLDLVNKGGSGTVFIPLETDDPLYVPGSNTNFMVLTRATVTAGPDGVMGTADDTRPVNTTTSFVDQNQTYTSHASHQVFLRQYEIGSGGAPVATGHLIEGGGAQPGGMATWGEVKTQAATMLGIKLTDFDVGHVPLLRTDPYGNFIPDVNGMPQIITGIGPDGVPNTADDITVSGNLANPVDPTLIGALRIDNAFLADIAHDAVPFGKIADGDIEVGLGNPGNGSTEYDNELLDAHFITGDGRANENIGLTAVHHIFHAEHNRLVEHTKVVTVGDAAAMLAGGATQAEATAFLNEWLAVDVAAVPVGAAAINTLVWDGERLFQAAKFGTEMQYQHTVFEDFARKIQPNIDFFVVPDGYHADINPSIVAEFAHVVYRFGHSMLTETVDRLDASFNSDPIGLIEAFLNPVAFDSGHTVADQIAAGDIIRGMTRQVGNEIDEFVTSALRNNLLGLPLDLATINLARGRDAGVPSLNAARREFFNASSNAPELKPYDSWVEFAGNLKNEASVINFIAAYGLHPLIVAETSIEAKRAVAMAIIFGTDQPIVGDPLTNADDRIVVAADIADATDFLNGTGTWASAPGAVTTTGLDSVDLWIGGLAEKILPFGGMLGSTFNFIFEVQMEQLQDGDRFYYLQRLDGLHLLSEMENNTFAKIISKNADAGHLPSDVFSTPGLNLEVDRTMQFKPGLGESAGADGILLDDPGTLVDESADNLGNDPTGGSILTPLVIRNNPATPGPDSNYLRYTGGEHVLLGGTSGNDTLVASEGDDTLYGDAGNDRMEGGAGNDQYFGGDGDDILTDLGGDDIFRTGAGNDVVNAGQGVDLVVTDAGQDFIVLGADLLDEAFAGTGNDFILGSKTTEQTMGGEGDDWIEIGAWTGAIGDNFDDQFARDSVTGHDVFHGSGGFDEFIGEGGDDIWFGSLGRGKFDGMSGFDWTVYNDYQFGVDADLNRLAFDANPVPPPNAALDTFSFVEGVSGSKFDDKIFGSDVTAVDMPTEGFRGSVLNAAGIALVNGLQAVVGAGVTSFDGGNILLGGDGSDVITGRGGDDIIDGDKWLNVRISVRANIGPDGGIGPEIASANSMTELVTRMFNRTFNPGQLQIVREILTANGAGDVDVAVFSDLRANYDLVNNPNGTISVIHARGTQTDGTDTLRNIERLRFSDGEFALNTPPTGAAVINDLTPTEGQLLTVNTATIADANGLGALSFQWQSSLDGVTWANIVGATTASFTPQNLPFTISGAQAGLQLRVGVTFTDGGGTAESVMSASTGPVGLNWSGLPVTNNVFNGNAGDDIAVGVGPIAGFGGNDTLNGNAGNDALNGVNGNDTITGGAGNDTITGGAGVDVAVYAGVANSFHFARVDTTTTITDVSGTEGIDTVVTAETLRFGGVDYTVVAGSNANNVAVNTAVGAAGSQAAFGLAGNDTVNGGAGNDILSGDLGNDTLNGGDQNDLLIGGGGNDLVNGGNGDDFISQVGGSDGRDIVNGGADSDTYRLLGDATAETFRIYTRAEALLQITGLTLAVGTEIVVTRNGTTNASVIAELDNIEELVVNTLNVTPVGPGAPVGGSNGGDTIQVFGNFNAPETSLSFNTITIDGGAGDDTVDITSLKSQHRIVFRSKGGKDSVVGTLRPQDIVELAAGSVLANYMSTTAANGATTTTDRTKSVSFVSDGFPEFRIEAANLPAPEAEPEAITAAPPVVASAIPAAPAAASAAPAPAAPAVAPVAAAATSGDDRWTGTAADDTYRAGSGDDVARGGSGDDIIDGGSGDDALYGGSGDDTIKGGSGDDTLSGGSGDDALDGGSGDDTLTGGSGDDVFRFGDHDVVTDFNTDDDLIDLSGLGITAGNFADRVVLAAAGGDTMVTIGAQSMRLTGVDSDDIDISAFHLAGPPATNGLAESDDEDDFMLPASTALSPMSHMAFYADAVTDGVQRGHTTLVTPIDSSNWPAAWEAQFSEEAAMQDLFAVDQYHTILV